MAENITNEFNVEVEQIEEKVFIKEEIKLEINAEIKVQRTLVIVDFLK